MGKKIIGKIIKIVFPYWCPFCAKRFITYTGFSEHYLKERKKVVPIGYTNPVMAKILAEKKRVNSKKKRRG